MEFLIYADGGCSGNKRDAGCRGAYAYCIMDVGGNFIVNGSGIVENTTNNRMELIAAIESLKTAFIKSEDYGGPKYVDCIIYSDSKYVVDNFTDYVEEWKKHNWRKLSGEQVINSDLWKYLYEYSLVFKSFKLKWVKGHSTNKYNQKVDEMVRARLYPE